MRRFASWTLLFALVSGMTAVAPVASADSGKQEHEAAEPTSLSAVVGAEAPDESIQALAFLPTDITADVGDTVSWSFPTHEPHTLTFLQPGQARPPAATAPRTPSGSTFDGTEFINSGILLDGATYSVTFGATGDFSFVCLIHAKMSGTIHVQPAGTPREQLNTDDDDNGLLPIARDEGRDLLQQGARLERQELRAVTPDTDAVTIGSGFVFSTGSGDESVMIARFLPGDRSIHVGDTIDWTATDPATPHTVTFGPAPTNPAAVINATNGSATLPTTPAAQTVSSGFLGEPFGHEHFSVTFNAPGTYEYYCALHKDLGMRGTITVS